MFRRSSGRYLEHKTLGIPFRTIPQRRKSLQFCTMEQKANSRNSVLNHSTEEKTTQNYVPWNKKRSKHFREFRSEEQKMEANSRNFVPKVSLMKTFCLLLQLHPTLFAQCSLPPIPHLLPISLLPFHLLLLIPTSSAVPYPIA